MHDTVLLLNQLIWDKLLITLLIGGGIYFTIRTRFIQIRYFIHSIRLMFVSRHHARKDPKRFFVSSFQAFCLSLAGRVGTGNLAGVAVAIYLGGPGAIFWMWVVAMLGMSTSYIESTLGQVFKKRDRRGLYYGGPAHYIERGLGQRWLAVIFSIFLIMTYGLTFNAVQANSIAAALENTFGFNQLIIGLALVVCTAIIVFGGVRRIFRFIEVAVPLMAVLYLMVAIVVIFINIEQFPAALLLIIKSAFGMQEAAAGGVAYMLNLALINGVKRGLFSNEAGMGATPHAAAAASPNPNHPAAQGFIQMLGVFCDTVLLCTATAFLIILSGVLESGEQLSGIVLTQIALNSQVGNWGSYFIAVSILLFAFTSIIANYYYGESNIKYIFNDERMILIYRLLVFVMVIFGSVSSVTIVWDLADLTMGLMAIINLISILLLSKIALQVLNNYESALAANTIPTFNRRLISGLDKKIAKDVWM